MNECTKKTNVIHSFIQQMFKCKYVPRTGLDMGCSVMQPQSSCPLGAHGWRAGGRQAHQQPIIRHHGDAVIELCVCSVEAPWRKTFVCLGKGLRPGGISWRWYALSWGLKCSRQVGQHSRWQAMRNHRVWAENEKPEGAAEQHRGREWAGMKYRLRDGLDWSGRAWGD